MARIRIPCLVAKTNKAGKTSWYWQPSKTLSQAGFTAMSLGSDEGAAIAAARARNVEVERWKSGAALPGPAIAARRQAGTVGALIERYRKEVVRGTKPGGQPRIRAKTATIYETSLKRLDAWAGDQLVSAITPARVRVLRDATAKPLDQGGIGHAAAFNLLKMGRQLFAFAERLEGPLAIARGTNPFASFELAAPPPRRTVWERDDDAAFDASAYALGMPEMVLARELALYTAQRESDLIAFTEAQFAPLEIFDPVLRARLADSDGTVWGWIFAQQKTSDEYAAVEMQIPLEPALAKKVAAAIRANRARDRAATPPRLLTHVLVDIRTGPRIGAIGSGQPWTLRAFCDAYRQVLDHAARHSGRPHMRQLTWHDLRRTRVVRLRRMGMPKEMIAALTGHSLQAIDAMLKVYGPIDPTITAQAIAASLAHAEAEAEAKPEAASKKEQRA